MSASQFILKSLFRRRRKGKKNSGFTLTELLIAMILTSLIITPLLSLVITLMKGDRQEQVKNESQQEIQAALDYIARDLQQAVYIYDADALRKDSDPINNPANSGIRNQIPPEAPTTGCESTDECVPVLAFWKRRYLDKDDTVNGKKIEDLEDTSPGSDKFIYSLVVYYLIKDAANAARIWSPVARIGRFEVRQGIQDPRNPDEFLLDPDDGFGEPFNITESYGNMEEAMNVWEKGAQAYTKQVNTLIDYVDDTKYAKVPRDVALQLTPPDDAGCETQTDTDQDPAKTDSSRVPPDIVPEPLDTGSFYACVNNSVNPREAQARSVVQVHIRGNAIARRSNNPADWEITDNNKETQLSNRPTASVRVAVRSLIFEKPF